jgi:hypothetical protein
MQPAAQKDHVIPLPLSAAPAEATPGARQEPDPDVEESRPMERTVLSAPHGIINTGTVHGGQHITAVPLEPSARDRGADGGV